jgi:predicted ATP-dependent endonuclease of OLD family
LTRERAGCSPVILVEGISEQLLLPVFAARLLKTKQDDRLDLKDSAVSVVLVGGLSFAPFYKLFRQGQVRMPCSVVTDGDSESGDWNAAGVYEPGSRALGVQADMDGYCKAFVAARTFEYELAYHGNADIMVQVFKSRHRVLGVELETKMAGSSNQDEKARMIQEAVKSAYKADLAQDLLNTWSLDDSNLVVPPYLESAICFACGVGK